MYDDTTNTMEYIYLKDAKVLNDTSKSIPIVPKPTKTKTIYHITTPENKKLIIRDKKLKGDPGTYFFESEKEALEMLKQLKSQGSPRNTLIKGTIPADSKIENIGSGSFIRKEVSFTPDEEVILVPDKLIKKKLPIVPIEEAKKYKSAEEFVKAQPNIAEYSPLDNKNIERSIKNLNEVGIPVKSGEDIITLYHGTNAKGMKGITESGTLNPFSYLATDKNASQGFAFDSKGGVIEIKVPVKDAGFVQTPMAGAKGATIQNPVKLIKGEDGIWRAEQWKTKSQLTDIWNKVNKKEKLPIVPKPKK